MSILSTYVIVSRVIGLPGKHMFFFSPIFPSFITYMVTIPAYIFFTIPKTAPSAIKIFFPTPVVLAKL